MNPIKQAETILKSWMLSKKLIKNKDKIQIIKTSWNVGYSVTKNGFYIGTGILNPKTCKLDNFKFNVFKHTKKKLSPNQKLNLEIKELSKTILPERKRDQQIIGKIIKGQKISIMG